MPLPERETPLLAPEPIADAPPPPRTAALDRRSVAGSSAEQALALYRAIFDRSTEPIAIVDPSGCYLEQNAAHERLVGYSDAELRGRTPAIHLGEEAFARIAAELAATGVSRCECVSRAKDGHTRTIELSAFAVRDAAGEPVCFVGIKRDVSEQRRAAATLRRRYDELHAVYRLADTVARAGALEEIYAAALDELQRTVGADRAAVLLYDDEGVMRFVAWRGLSAAYRGAVEGHSPWRRDDPAPRPVLVPDVEHAEELAPLRPVFAAEGIRAVGFVPLVDAGRLLGKFMIYFDAPHVVESAERRLAETIARHIAFAISRARADVERRARERAQRLLAEAGALLNSSLDFEETLRSVTRLVVPAVADWCLVDLTDDAGGFERIAAVAAREEDAPIAERLQRRYGPRPDVGVTRAARTESPELVARVDDALLVTLARDAEHLALLRAMRIASYMCVPLVTRGRTVGVLTFVVGVSGRRYDAADLPLAEELARRAALAVDNARLYREAQAANLAKSEFLARMSHELRTPLNAIGGYTELLEMGLRGPITDAQREDLTRIQRSQRHLLGLINDLLSFARIESGHLSLAVERVTVEETLAGVQTLIAPQVAAKGVRYRQAATNGDAPAACLADRDKLRQVLLNLVSNAVKFTPRGGEVTVAWDVAPDGVRVHVHDTGPGIPPHMVEAIFEPFVQVATGPTRIAEGAGLGLAISRELARAMGGDVTVATEMGRGSTFTLTLPRG